MAARWARRVGAGMVAVAALGLAGCDGGPDEPTSPAGATTSATEAGERAEADPGEPQLYFTAGEQFRKVDADLPREGPDAVRAAVQALVAGPEGAEAQTQIPADVTVDSVDVADGTATVELSEDFLEGVPARAARRDDAQRQEIAARLGQLTYTLTQFEEVEAVDVVAGGVAVERESERADFAAPERGPRREQRPKGERSASTRELQRRLVGLQYLPRSAVDGVPGYRTRQAVIAFQSWEGLARDGIVGPQTRAALKRARPPKPRAGGPARRLEVYRERGVVLLIAGGRVKRAIHVSTGAPGTPTPAGTFEVFRKELKSWSVPFQVWLPYASYFTGGIAFHEYPDVPVFPASHGCVRVPAPEAQIVYRFAKLGTAVVVI